MRITDILRMSWKNLTSNKMRTLLTILGISVGIATIVFLISIGFGLQELSIRRIGQISSLTALDVTPVQGNVSLNEAYLKDFEKIPNVEKVSPLFSFSGQVSEKENKSDLVAYAVNPDYFSLQGIKIKAGTIFNDSKNPIVVSTGIIKALSLSEDNIIGKEISLQGSFPKESGGDFEIKNFNSVVVGIIDDSSSPFAYLPLSSVQGFLNKNTLYNSAKVKVTTTENIGSARSAVESKGFKVTSISDTIGQIYIFFNYIQIVLVSFGAIALLVASIGMFNTMTIALLERTRDIGIMKAIGVQNGSVKMMFLTESFLISSLGGVIGIGIGIGLGKLVNFIINMLAKSVGGQPEKMFTTPIYAIVIIIGFSLLVGVATGIYPAKRAGKLNPLDALRYE